MTIYYDEQPGRFSRDPRSVFPICRYDSRAFVWVDAFYEGNYCAVHSSAQGQGGCRERFVEFLTAFKADKSHFCAFELEIDGMRLRDYFEFEDQWQETTHQGFEQHTVSLLYPIKNARVRVCTLLDGSSFMVRWLEVENIGKQPFAVTGMFPMAGILYPETPTNTFSAEHLRPKTQVGSFCDNYYLGEGEFFWQDLPKATLKFGHEHAVFNPPMYILKDDVSCQMTMLHIETTMMPQAEFTRSGDYYYSRPATNADYVHFKAGIDQRATFRVIEPGQSVVSPKIHLGQVYGDLDVCINEFNEHLRLSVIPKRNQEILYPIEYNHSSYTVNCQINKKYLLEEVDIAATIGSEVFVVDAGWFGSASRVWYDSRGDWQENELLENGLAEVFDYARKKGMMCGLWMEAEAADFNSDLAKKHPEWLISANGKKLPMLNLRLPEVERFVFNSICNVIDKYQLDLFRIDGGLKQPTEELRDSVIEGTSWEYYEKLYDIFERIRERYPHLYLENCSGGGGRSDLAMMRRFDWMQATDNFAPAAQLRTVYGMSLAFAPEQLQHVAGGLMKHQTDADFLSRTVIFGRPQISGIADKDERINPYCKSAWQNALKIYREEIRPMLSTCRIFHHTPFERYMEKGQWVVLELASPQSEKSVTGIFRLEGEETGQYRLFPKGISLAKTYEVYSDNLKESITLQGFTLIHEGYPVNLPGKLTSEMIIISEKSV